MARKVVGKRLWNGTYPRSLQEYLPALCAVVIAYLISSWRQQRPPAATKNYVAEALQRSLKALDASSTELLAFVCRLLSTAKQRANTITTDTTAAYSQQVVAMATREERAAAESTQRRATCTELAAERAENRAKSLETAAEAADVRTATAEAAVAAADARAATAEAAAEAADARAAAAEAKVAAVVAEVEAAAVEAAEAVAEARMAKVVLPPAAAPVLPQQTSSLTSYWSATSHDELEEAPPWFVERLAQTEALEQQLAEQSTDAALSVTLDTELVTARAELGAAQAALRASLPPPATGDAVLFLHKVR